MATCPECRIRYPETAIYCDADGAALVPDATFAAGDRDLSPGELVGEYRIERRIGKGSFGVVYAAVHPVIGKAAAVKILTRECSGEPHTVSRFISEARAVNQIRHRNIVDIFSFGALSDGRQYYVMELLDGEPLDQYLASQGPIRPSQALPILDRIARALDAAHEAGIVHRDLKPANVFLAIDTDGVRFPKLLDFGIAKLTREERIYGGHRTHTGAVLGTPYYMSPEQCRGESVDYRADLYAFGVMVHEMLTGQLPFTGDSLLQIMTNHTSAEPPKMSGQQPALSPELDGPVLQLLEKEPARRPRSAGDAYRELLEAARAAGYSVPPTTSRSEPAAGGPGGAADTAGRLRNATRSANTFRPQTLSNRPPRRLIALTTAVTTGTVAVVLVATLAAHFREATRLAVASAAPRADASAIEAVGSAAPAADPTNAPTVVPSVRLSVQSTPPSVEAFLEGRSLGVAPGPLTLPRGEIPLSVVFRAAGYAPKSVDLTPSADGTVSVTLNPISATPVAHPRPKRAVDDLEF